MATATTRKAVEEGVTLELSTLEAHLLLDILKQAPGALARTLRGLLEPQQLVPRIFSRVRMTKGCGRWIKPGELGIISSINQDDAAPEGTIYTIALEPGRYQTMTRECFEVLPPLGMH